jgi:glutamine synthetase
MLHGIELGLDPGPPVQGNGYDQALPGELPTQWHEAIERAARSGFLRAALGERFLDVFIAIKRQECGKFGALVTDRDYEWYLDGP